MVPAVKREYYKKFLNEALPIESQLTSFLPDAFVAEISSGMVTSTQDAVDWSTYTYFYRRLLANPSWYGLNDVTHDGLSAFLSELVENTLKDLQSANIIELDEDDDSITPLNPCRIAAYYNISYFTMQTLLLSLSGKTKLKGLLEIVSSATEYDDLQIRRHEDSILRRIYDRVPVKLAEAAFDDPHFKAFVLLQAHFSRMALPVDLAKDQEMVLKKVLNLLSAAVDVLSSEGHLNAMRAMELSQMVVQAMWDRDSALKQIPHFDDRAVGIAQKAGIDDIDSFMNAMDPSENPDYAKLVSSLGFDNRQLAAAAEFTNERYPNIDISFEILDQDDIATGSPAFLQVTIERQIDEDEEPNTQVHAPFYPLEKTENWWLVVGNEATNSLYGIKRVTIGRTLTTKLDYIVQQPGKQELKLYLICDSYFGVDQDPSFEITAAEGMEEDDEEEEDEE